MNADLKKFVELIGCSENQDDGYGSIINRKIVDGDLDLTCNYVYGGAVIKGTAFGKAVKTKFNRFKNKTGFNMCVDGKELSDNITIYNVLHFFGSGKFLPGTHFKDGSMAFMRDISVMNHLVWDLLLADIDRKDFSKYIPADLITEVNAIKTSINTAGCFTDKLKQRACVVEFECSTYKAEYIRDLSSSEHL